MNFEEKTRQHRKGQRTKAASQVEAETPRPCRTRAPIAAGWPGQIIVFVKIDPLRKIHTSVKNSRLKVSILIKEMPA